MAAWLAAMNPEPIGTAVSATTANVCLGDVTTDAAASVIGLCYQDVASEDLWQRKPCAPVTRQVSSPSRRLPLPP